MNCRERSMSKSFGVLAIVFVLVFSAMIIPVNRIAEAEQTNHENQ